MTDAFIYNLGAALFLMAGYIGYKITLAKCNQPSFNRIMILALYAGAALWIVFPGLHLATGAAAAAEGIEIGKPAFAMAGADAPQPSWLSQLPWGRIAAGAWVAGMIVAAVTYLTGLVRLRKFIREGKRIEGDGYILIVTSGERHTPFSWMRYVVIDSGDYASAHAGMAIEHEVAHIRHRHSLDLFIANLFCIVQWFNPAAWLMKDELRDVEEYQIDSDMLSRGIDRQTYQMLIIEKAVGNRFLQLANSLNQSQLKKRLTMMMKSKAKKRTRLRAAALVPAMIAAATVINLPYVASAMEAVSDSKITASQPEKQMETSTPDPENAPQFPGGEPAMMKFLIENLNYPAEAIANNIQGNVIVSFRVLADGRVANVEAKNSIHPLLDAEAIRVVEAMPRWTPGKTGGKAVITDMVIPVRFKLQPQKSRTPNSGERATARNKKPQTPGGETAMTKKQMETSTPDPENAPEFSGGQPAMMKFLIENLNYPAEAKANNIQGNVIVSFRVLADGRVANVEARKSVHPLLDAEAIRVVEAMPRWTPGTAGGKAVETEMVVPIAFRLPSAKPGK